MRALVDRQAKDSSNLERKNSYILNRVRSVNCDEYTFTKRLIEGERKRKRKEKKIEGQGKTGRWNGPLPAHVTACIVVFPKRVANWSKIGLGDATAWRTYLDTGWCANGWSWREVAPDMGLPGGKQIRCIICKLPKYMQ